MPAGGHDVQPCPHAWVYTCVRGHRRYSTDTVKEKTSGSVRFCIKSALDGYSFYELSLELLSKPTLDLTAYKGHYIPDFLLELEHLKQDVLDGSLVNIFPKQTAAAQAVMNHSTFYKV